MLTPWTTPELNRLKADLEAYFRAYYSELLEPLEEDPEALPEWARGRRLIHVIGCSDGVVVGHVYPDKPPPHAKPKADADGNLFWFEYRPQQPVKAAVQVFAPPPRTGGECWPQWNPPNYAVGRRFGSHVITTPLEFIVPMDEGHYASETWDVWSRLEWADKVSAAAYRNLALARQEAQDLIRRHRQDRGPST